MKLLRNICIGATIALTTSSCSDWVDINHQTDQPTIVTPEQALPVVLFYASQINYDHAEYGVYLSQALTTGGRAQKTGLDYKSGWEFLTMNRHPQWRRHFYDIGVNGNELIKAAEKIESPNFTLIARTVQLMSMQLTTDAFGDMPRSEAYMGTNPRYDSQESIYAWMLEEADKLIADYDNPEIVNAPGNKKITSKMDRVFHGDLQKWKHFTIALKARILLRKLPNWDNNQAACDAIIASVDAALAGWEEPLYRYDGGTAESNSPWGSTQPAINGWESRKNELNKAIPSEFLMRDMLGDKGKVSAFSGSSEDPRMEALMTPRTGPTGTTDTSKKYRYLKNNIGMDISYKEDRNYPDLYASVMCQNSGYVALMLTEELLFMKAEALYWKKDVMGAYELTKEATRMNMERLTPMEGNANFVLKPAKYLKQVEAFFKNAKLMEKYLPESGFNIGHLMRQKYIAMMYQPEQWTDMRRYNYSNDINQNTYDGAVVYPKLRRPYNLFEAYWMQEENGELKQEWIQRINYDPETEEKYNSEELKRLGAYKNPEWLKKPMIWGRYNGSHK